MDLLKVLGPVFDFALHLVFFQKLSPSEVLLFELVTKIKGLFFSTSATQTLYNQCVMVAVQIDCGPSKHRIGYKYTT